MTAPPVFPCSELPESPAACRLLGLYPQRQEGLLMQRIKLAGGVLEPRQWLALADCCDRFTPGTPLLITTRQDVEFHNLTAGAVPQLQQALAAAGFTGLGACGDTLRNITLCPGNGLTEGAADLGEAARAVRQALEGYADIFSLPRKFKVNFSGCAKACGQPWINDLSFVARRHDGGFRFQVIGAGSLGPRPAAGIVLHEELAPQDAPAFALAAVSLFNRHGDREHRGRARLRHVRERLGDREFLKLLQEFFEHCRSHVPPGPGIALPAKVLQRAAVLTFPCGLVSADQARALGLGGFTARIQNHHRIALYAEDPQEVERRVAAEPGLAGCTGGPDIVSCPGATWCTHAIINTHSLERQLRESLPADCTASIRISGCPNGCAHSAVGQIGLTGRVRRDDRGSRCEGVQVLAGGGMGLTPALARELDGFVPVAGVAVRILNLLHEQECMTGGVRSGE